MLSIEWTKLLKRKSTVVLLTLHAISITLQVVFYGYMALFRDFNLNNSTGLATLSLNMMMTFLLPLIALYTVSESFTTGTMQQLFSLPTTKQAVYLAKIATALALLAVLLAAQFAITGVVGALIEGQLSLLGLGSLLLQYIGALLALTILTLWGAVLAVQFRSTGIVILISYLLYIAFGIAGFYYPVVDTISPNTILANYATLLSTHGISQLLSTAAYYIILVMTGFHLFTAKDFYTCQSE